MADSARPAIPAAWCRAAFLVMASLWISTPAGAQTSGAGANLWKNFDANNNPTGKGCEGCHGSTPSGARANASLSSVGNSTNLAYAKGILNNAISNSGSMSQYANGGSKDLTETEKESLLLYLETVFNTTPKTATTSFETAKNIDLGDDVELSGTVAGNLTLVTGSNVPNHGSVSYNGSLKRITYTPSDGWVGDDTFTYRARNSGDTLSTAERTVTVTTNPPPAPNISSSTTKSGKVGVFLSYTITASNSPTSFGSGSLPPGLNRSGATISGTPTTFDSSYPTTISATNAGGTDSQTLTFSIAKGDPVLNLPDQTPNTQPFRPNTTFSIDAADSDSPGTITYTVSPGSRCTNSGLTVTKVGAGQCSITAAQASTANWNAPLNKVKTVTITPAQQSLSFPAQVPSTYVFVDGDTFAVDPATSSPTTDSGNPITYGSTDASICTVAGTTVTMQGAGNCVLTANQAGNTNYAAAAQVTQTVVLTAGEPGPPTVTSVIGGDARATILITAPPNPGSPITSYTGTCDIGGTNAKTGTSPNPPVIVTGLTNGAPYSCRVTATNAIGTSVTSNSVGVTPSAAAAAPVFRSASSVTFTIGTAKSYRVATTGTPSATLTVTSGTLPSGLTYAIFNTSGTRLISGTADAGTAGSYIIAFSASNASGTATQSLRINVVKAPQTVTFPVINDRAFSPSTFSVSASASSGLGVTYSSQTSGICTVTSGGVVTMVTVGTCTLRAIQAGDGTYLPANADQSFEISQATQSISWGTLPNKTFVANGMFVLSPLASATSGLPITYTSLLTANCTVSGNTVTMVQVGACNIEAAQDGNANYLPANDFIRGFSISKGTQTITFPTQAAQSFVDGGTFPIDPPATGGASGNPVVYSTQTASVCTVSASTVTMHTTGTCTIAANQAGNNNYLAANPVLANIAINASVPGAPTAQTATPSDQGVSVEFLPPASDGGSALLDYRLTCDPGNAVASNAASPIATKGLANGISASCTVAARNAVGFGPESNVVMATPFLRSGTDLWTTSCSACHGGTPSAGRFNAAGDTGTVIDYVRARQETMQGNAVVQALTANELSEIAKYIKTFVPALTPATNYVTPVMVDVGLPNHLYLGGVAFTEAVVVGPPVNGTLSAFNGTVITYTPNVGFAGTDTFTYRGRRTSPQLLEGEARTMTITVNAPVAPLVTSAGTADGVFNQAFAYQITATESPASFGASGLPPGVGVNTANGAISGSPTAAGVYAATVSATNPGGTGTKGVTITISAANQSITFNAQPSSQPFGSTFPVSPLANASSGLTVTYSSLTPSTCSVTGTTVTPLAAGTCTLAADQGGNANYNAALQATQNVTINAVQPGAPTGVMGVAGVAQASLSFTAPANTGGSAITQYNATCSPSGSGSSATSPITVAGLANGTQYSCTVTATNAAALTGPSSSPPVLVTPSAALVAPSITSPNSASFTVLSSGTFTLTATGNLPPALAVTGTLPTGVNFAPATGVLSGTPASGTATTYPLTFSASNASGTVMQSFTLTVSKVTQSITFPNPGTQSYSLSTIPLSAGASSGLAVALSSNTPAVCTVAGGNLTTVAPGVCSLTATQAGNADYQAANDVTRAFTIAKADQSITFGAQASPRNFSTTPFALSPVAFSTSGLGIVYSTTTPSVCAMSGNNVNTLSAGICTIAADQPGNANYNAAPQVTRNVTVDAVAPAAPVIGTANGSDMTATLNFTPPSSTGGSPISTYTATCNPGGATGSNAASPVSVGGLTNGTPYTCTVTATNQAGKTSAASGSVMVTPTSANGGALWSSVCANCHAASPSGNQLNGAGSTATVLQHVRTTQSLMAIFPPVQNLTQSELAAIAIFIRDQLPALTPTTPQNTAVQIDVGGHVHLTNQAWSAFTSVDVVMPPANGVLGAFAGTVATYTPNPGFAGTDTFTYRGRRTSPAVDGDPVQVTVTVFPGAPVVTGGAGNGTFGAPFTYSISATGSPSAYGASGLPGGLAVNPATGAISGMPTQTGTFSVTLSATNAGGTGMANLMLTVAPAAQAITFDVQTPAARDYVQDGVFVISPLATGGASDQAVVYGSASPLVCSVSGINVSILAAGSCVITANQSGNANYGAAPQVTQAVTINAVLPGAPGIGNATPGNGTALIAFNAPANTGGAPVLSYAVSCTPSGSASGPASPVSVSGLTNGVTYNCSVRATNSAGQGPASASVGVTPLQQTAPGAPLIGVPTELDGAARIAFSAPLDNGGSPITGYTATCNPGPVSVGGGGSPITVNSLTNGITYTCSVTAANAIGTSAASSTVMVTPQAAIVLDHVESRKQHGAVTGNLPLATGVDLTGNFTIEPRVIGSGHQIVFVFSAALGGISGNASVLDASGNPFAGVSANVVASGNEAIVTLGNVPEAARLTVQLSGAGGNANASVSLGFLVGDVNGSGAVTAADIAAVKRRLSATVDASNFRFDLNASGGAIGPADVSAVKARSGTSLP